MNCPFNRFDKTSCLPECTFFNSKDPVTGDGECIVITMAKTLNSTNLNLIQTKESLRIIRGKLMELTEKETPNGKS